MKPSELKKDLENRLDRHVNEPRTVWTNGGRTLFNHQDFVNFYKIARNPKKGRRLASSYWIKSSNGQHVSDCYSVYVYDSTGFELCRITADNVLEFVVEPRVVWQHSQSLVSSLQNWIPILVYRHKKGLYRVIHSQMYDKLWESENTIALKKSITDLVKDNLPEDVDMGGDVHKYYHQSWRTFDSILKKAPRYFKGIKFDMLTWECINPMIEPEWIEKPEERKLWRKCVSRYKRRIKAMERVGALDGIKQEVMDDCKGARSYDWKQPNWEAEEWVNLLYNSMRNGKYPRELMKGIVESRQTYGWGISVEPIDTVKNMEKIFRDLSIILRRKFNVFEQEGHEVYSSDLKHWRSNYYDTIAEQS